MFDGEIAPYAIFCGDGAKHALNELSSKKGVSLNFEFFGGVFDL